MTEVDQGPEQGSPDDVVADPTPDPGTPATIDWESDENPYRTRFEDYRRGADQKATRLSQYEQAVQDFQSGDPAEMRRAAAILGIADHLEIEEPEPPMYDTPEEELAAKYAALEARFDGLQRELTEREQKQQEAAQVAAIRAGLDSLGITDETERNVVLGTAWTLPLTDDGLPDVKAAQAAIEARDNARMRAWGETKNAPRSIQPGSPATQQKNVADMSREEAINWAAQRLDDMNAAD